MLNEAELRVLFQPQGHACIRRIFNENIPRYLVSKGLVHYQNVVDFAESVAQPWMRKSTTMSGPVQLYFATFHISTEVTSYT